MKISNLNLNDDQSVLLVNIHERLDALHAVIAPYGAYIKLSTVNGVEDDDIVDVVYGCGTETPMKIGELMKGGVYPYDDMHKLQLCFYPGAYDYRDAAKNVQRSPTQGNLQLKVQTRGQREFVDVMSVKVAGHDTPIVVADMLHGDMYTTTMNNQMNQVSKLDLVNGKPIGPIELAKPTRNIL